MTEFQYNIYDEGRLIAVLRLESDEDTRRELIETLLAFTNWSFVESITVS